MRHSDALSSAAKQTWSGRRPRPRGTGPPSRRSLTHLDGLNRDREIGERVVGTQAGSRLSAPDRVWHLKRLLR
jgi:hypothetical protein